MGGSVSEVTDARSDGLDERPIRIAPFAAAVALYAAAWVAVAVRLREYLDQNGAGWFLSITAVGWFLGIIAYRRARSKLAAQTLTATFALGLLILFAGVAGLADCEGLECLIPAIFAWYSLIGLGLAAPATLLVLARRLASARKVLTPYGPKT